MKLTAMLLAAALAILLVLPGASTSSGQTPTPGVTYRLIFYDRDSSRLAPDGATYRVLSANTAPSATVACATGTITAGYSELEVVLSAQCPAGTAVLFEVAVNDGRAPFLAVARPDLEWRARRAGETTIDAVVMILPPPTPTPTPTPTSTPVPPTQTPVPALAQAPSSAGAPSSGSSPVTGTITPPSTGDAGLR